MKKIIKSFKRIALTASILMIIQLGYQLFVNGSLKAYADTPPSTQNIACVQADSQITTSDSNAQCQPPASDAADSTSGTSVVASNSNSQTATTSESNVSTDPGDQTNTTVDDSSDPTVSSDQPNDYGPAPSTSDQGSSSSSSVAETGNADDSLDEVNTITSGSSAPASTVADNVDGNETGDIDVDPSNAPSGQYSSNDTSALTTNSSASSTAAIDNNDTLTASSGNSYIASTTSSNTASTGNAAALASIVNLIGILNDNQTYVETINIYGNLDGNVLLPDELASELVDPSSSVIEATPEIINDSITNNISETSSTGSALITSSGVYNNASSGSATNETNITNYVDNVISGDNLFLIIVNVSGTAEGYILGQPTANGLYLVGTDITGNGITITEPGTTSSNTIENDINLTANTGSATIDSPNSVSNIATTGNAFTGVNVVNFEGSEFNLSGLFGILFINVFGNWDGSLMSYDNTATVSTISTPIVTAAVVTTGSPNTLKTIDAGPTSSSNTNASSNAASLSNAKLTAKVVKPSSKNGAIKSNSPDLSSSSSSDWIMVLAILPLIALFAIERFIKKNSQV